MPFGLEQHRCLGHAFAKRMLCVAVAAMVWGFGFDVPEARRVRLSIYDIKGRLVRLLVDEPLDAGHHTTRWDGVDANGVQAASGVYLVLMEAGDFRTSKKITLLK